jgi:hypothetical protein
MNIKNKEKKLGFSLTGTLLVILIVGGLAFGGYKIIAPTPNSPSDTTNFNKATNKELDDFYKWDKKQQEQKRENQPAFNNGN